MKKTRIISMFLAVLMALTSAPLVTPVLAAAETSSLDFTFVQDRDTRPADRYLKVTNNPEIRPEARLFTDYTVDAGKTYTVKFDVKCDDPYFLIRVGTTWRVGPDTDYDPNEKGKKLDIFRVGIRLDECEITEGKTAEDGWYTVSFPYKTITSHNFELSILEGYYDANNANKYDDFNYNNYNSGADFCIDNFSLCDESGNAVISYDFDTEKDNSEDWVPSTSNFTLTTEKHPPKYDYSLLVAERAKYDAGLTISSNYRVIANTAYNVSFKIKPYCSDPGNFPISVVSDVNLTKENVDMNIYKAKGESLCDSACANDIGDGWYQVTIPFDVLQSSNFAFSIHTGTSSSDRCSRCTHDFQIDDFKLSTATTVFALDFDTEATRNGYAAYNSSTIEVVSDDADTDASCGLGVSLDTGLDLVANTTYTVDVALNAALSAASGTGFEQATVFVDLYTDASNKQSFGPIAVTDGEYAGGYYKHSFEYTPAVDGILALDVMGGAAFADPYFLEDAPVLSFKSISVAEDGASDPIYEVNCANKEEAPSYTIINETNRALDLLAPREEVDVFGTSGGSAGVIAILLLRKKAALAGGDVKPDDDVVKPGTTESLRALAVLDRTTFWCGTTLASYQPVYAGKSYTISLELKSDGVGDDFRCCGASGKVTDNNLGTSSGMLFTNGTPIEGREGWYSFKIKYIPTEDHILTFSIFGGYNAKGDDSDGDSSNGNFYLDNFMLYENGVEDPILVYDFETDKYFDDWGPFKAPLPSGTPYSQTIKIIDLE